LAFNLFHLISLLFGFVLLFCFFAFISFVFYLIYCWLMVFFDLMGWRHWAYCGYANESRSRTSIAYGHLSGKNTQQI